jgi:Cu(I)/Ag(I) efflux system periplasmic protein CusF
MTEIVLSTKEIFMKESIVSVGLVFALGTSLPFPSFSGGDHDSHHSDTATNVSASTPMTLGEVKKVDRDAGKVTLKHGPIGNLEMPAMTMVFRVKETAVLDQLKEGDRIKFSADKINGAFTLIQILPAN